MAEQILQGDLSFDSQLAKIKRQTEIEAILDEANPNYHSPSLNPKVQKKLFDTKSRLSREDLKQEVQILDQSQE